MATRDCDALNARIEALGKLLDEREERTKDRFHAMEKMTNSAFDASEKAIEKADAANQRHFTQINEFRAALEDQTRKYLEKTVFDVQHHELQTRMASIEERQTAYTSAAMAQTRLAQMIAGSILALATPSVAFLIYLLQRH